MGIELIYGKASLTFALPAHASVDIFSPAKVEGIPDPEHILALKEAGALAMLKGRPLFVVNDGHRSTPTARILTWLDGLDPGFLAQSEFLIATGSHDPPTPEHLDQIFGPHLYRVRGKLSYHSATDSDSMTSLGLDQFGEEVFLNSKAAQAKSICVISSVEPHYFAGFTGGRKSFFPGLTDLATIERNHNLAASLEAQPMRLSGNPVAEHMASMMAMADPEKLFSIQAVIDSEGEVAQLFAGEIESSFASAVSLATEAYSYTTETPYDLLLCEMRPPLDGNLYQAQKGLENAQEAVADGGACVVVSACSHGIGSKHFYELASGWDRDKNCPLDGPPRFGSHKLSRVNQISKRILVGMKSELDEPLVRHVFYEPISDLDAFLKERSAGRADFRIGIVKDAGNRVLRLKNG